MGREQDVCCSLRRDLFVVETYDLCLTCRVRFGNRPESLISLTSDLVHFDAISIKGKPGLQEAWLCIYTYDVRTVRVGRLGWGALLDAADLPRGFSPPSVSKWKDPRSTFTASEIFHLPKEFVQHASAKHNVDSVFRATGSFAALQDCG